MKAPAFQFYPQDFISSLDVQVMTVEQIGGYWLLLTNAWIHEPQGYLPNNDLLLQRICRMNDKQWSKNKSLILKKFEKDGEYIFNARLLRELEKQGEYRKKQAQNGAKGGRPKANDNPEKPTAFSGETQTEPKKSSSISSSSSSLFSTTDSISKESTIPTGSKEPSKYEAFLKFFNDLTKRNFKTLDSKAKNQLDKLKKAGYRYNDFIAAITNGFEDSQTWLKPGLFTPEYITREANFTKYLHWQSAPGRKNSTPGAASNINQRVETMGKVINTWKYDENGNRITTEAA